MQGENNPNFRHGHATGGQLSPTYSSWKSIWQRCENPKHPRYADYGGRGITIAENWRSFPQFLADMGERPFDMTLDRIDNNKGYSKENCRWASITTQNLNQRVRKKNTLGITGVVYQQNRFYASARVSGKLRYFYSGIDFFEACCARKSWDSRRGHGK